jgi:hypothetical protein
MKLALDYVDEIYHFPGLWETPSLCGLKIARHPERHVVVATDLWDQNPGSSVTEVCAALADRLCAERGLDPERLLFIEHSPETGSKLEIYHETFDRVEFDRRAGRFCNPRWTRIDRDQVDAWLG